jgi:glutamate dehydrogenase/leucine dehydrogenase
MGGSEGRREATGRGVMITTREAARHLGIKMEGATVAIQGFGNVGSVSADLSPNKARKSSPSPIGRAASTTLPASTSKKLIAWTSEHRTVAGFPGADKLATDKLFDMDVDILIPAALENQITVRTRPASRPDHHRRRQRPDDARSAQAAA